MKKIYIAVCTLAIALFLSACNEPAGPTVAVVNAGQVFQECESGKQAREYMEKLAEEMQADLRSLQDDFENAPAARKEDAQRKLQSTVIEYQQRLRAEEQQILNKLTEDYQSVLDEYRTANNLSLILRSEAMVSTSAEADITQKIIEAMNKKTTAEASAAIATQAPAAVNATDAPAAANATAPEAAPASSNATAE